MIFVNSRSMHLHNLHNASDYDVRGNYVKNNDDYLYLLVVSKDKGIIHYNNEDLDIVLWDVVKVLSLYFKSANQVFIWWLTSYT